MKITIDVEPVLYPGRHVTEPYYAFRIIGLKDAMGDDMDVRGASLRYPGNEAMRKFINERATAQHQARDANQQWSEMSATERHRTLQTMEAWGGGFAQKLAKAWIVADSGNAGKLADAFPELVEKYGPKSWFYGRMFPESQETPTTEATQERNV